MRDGRSPWDRHPEESVPAFEAFKAYRDLDGERSLSAAAAVVGKSVSMLARWSSRHSWSSRVSAMEAEQDREWQRRRHRARVRALDRNLSIIEVGKLRVEADLATAKTDTARLLDVVLKHERAILEPTLAAPGRSGGSGSQFHDDSDLDDLTDEEILLRMLDLWAAVEDDLRETAKDLQVPFEDLRATVHTMTTVRGAR